MSQSERPNVDRGTVGRGALWSLAGVGAGQGVALLTFLVTARYVSKDSFGVMALSLGIVEFMKRVGVESFAYAVAGRVDAEAEDYDACFVLSLASTAVMVAAALVGAEIAARVADAEPLADALRLAAALVLSIGLWRTHETWLSRHMRFRALAVRSILAAAAGGVVGVLLAVRGFQLWSLVGQQLTTSALSLVLFWVTTPWRPRLRVPAAALLRCLDGAKHMALSALGSFLSSETDILVASMVLGVAAAGLYNAAKRLTLALSMFLTGALQNVALSAFANMADADRRRGAALRAVSVVAAVTLPAAFGIVALAQPIVSVLLGDKWIAAAPVLAALAIGLATSALLQFNTTMFMVTGRLSSVTRYATAHAALNVAVLPAAALLGNTALALGVSGVQLAIFPFATRTALASVGLPASAYVNCIARPLLASAAMAALLAAAQRGLALEGIAALAVLVPLGAAIYGVALACVGPAALRELVGLARSILRSPAPRAGTLVNADR